jgi:hypothetical protein
MSIKVSWSKSVLARRLPYFIKYNVHTSIVRTWISQWFLTNFLFLFFKNNFTRINHCKFICHKSHFKPFLSYLPCIVCREYFSIIFNVKKSALYLIKYGICHLHPNPSPPPNLAWLLFLDCLAVLARLIALQLTDSWARGFRRPCWRERAKLKWI